MQALPRGDRRPMSALLPLIAAAAMGLGLAAPRQAAAGEYTIFACQADSAGYSSGAFEDFATRGMRWRRACNPLGPGLRGLVTANVPGTGRVLAGAQSAFVLNAPPGTAFSTLRWSGHARRRDCRYALQLYAERPGAPPVAIKNVRANRSCPRPGAAQASSWPRMHAYDLGGATRIVQRTVCVGAPGHEYCSARGQNYIRTFAAEATVVDGIAPSAEIVQDSPLSRGEWVRGKQSLDYEASDNVGVKGASAVLDGQARGSDARPCNYSQRVPCSNGRGTMEVDTEEAPEGSRQMTVAAEDGAGNRAESSPLTVRIDNTAPGVVAVHLAGGEGWRNSNDFDSTWANSPEGDRAPITAAHYRLCHSGGSECVSGDRAGGGVSAVERLSVPSPGEWELELWREDAAGNQEMANASAPVRLRFDPEPPQLGFEPQSADDPTRVSVLATDHISGVAGGEIEISRAGSGTWQVLPSSQEGEHLIARINDASLPPGDYELRASAHDQANNVATTSQRLDGQPMRLRLPLRTASSLRMGALEKRIVHRKGKKGRRRRTVTVLEKKVMVSFGRRVRLAGQLLDGAGKPLAGAKLLVYALPSEGTEQLSGTVTTGASGHFAYAIKARVSQRLRFLYPGTPTVLPAEGTVSLLVKASSTFSVKPTQIVNGDSVIFSGRVKGRPLPEAGKLLELQVLLTDEWQTFRTVRSKPDGTWRIVYRFQRTCGVHAFHFRVHLPAEATYPLASSSTRGVTVRVRGRPC